MIAPARYYTALRRSAERGNPVAKEVLRIYRVQAITAAICMIPLIYVIGLIAWELAT